MAYAACCEPLHQGSPAADAVALMRSRYSAYAMNLLDYLLISWHESTRPQDLNLDVGTQWLGLKVKRHEQLTEDTALVEFVARYRAAQRAHRLVETSRFRRENGHWFYIDGETEL